MYLLCEAHVDGSKWNQMSEAVAERFNALISDIGTTIDQQSKYVVFTSWNWG